MPDPSKGITITINAETAKAAAGLQDFFSNLNQQLGKLGSMGEMLEGLGGKLEAFLSIGALMEFSRDAMQSARSMAQLSAAMRSTGQASSEFQEELEKQRKALSAATGTAEDDIVTAQRLLLSFGARREDMKQLTGLTLDYAAAMGTSAAGAAEQLGRAISGGNIMIRGMRIEIDQSLPKAEQLGVLMEILSNRVGGQARAAFEAAAPNVERFNLQLKETEKAMGNVFLEDVASPFLAGVGEGLARIEIQLQSFNKTFPEVAASLRGFFGLLGDIAGKLSPAIFGLGLLVAAIQSVKFAYSALVPVIGLVREGITAMGSASFLPMLGWIAAATTALYAGVEAWRAWNAAKEEKASAAAAAASDQDMRAAMIRAVDSGTQSGSINTEAARAFEAQINALDRAGLSAEAYHSALVKIAGDIRKLIVDVPQMSLEQDLFLKKISEQQKAYEAGSAAGKSRGAIGALSLDEARNESAYQRGTISLQEYLAQRRKLLAQAAEEEQIPLRKAIDLTTDELIKKRDQLAQLENSQNYAEYAKVSAELDKLKLQKEKQETELLVSQQNQSKRSLDTDNFAFQNPTTVGGGIDLGFSDALKQMGTTYKDIANIISTTIGSSISSVSKGITGLVMGTETWRQALKQIGSTILTSVVQSIVEMGVKWVATHVLMRAASEATAALMQLLGIQQKAQNTQTLATGAAAGVGTAGAEGGWAGILIYLGVLAAALAATAALSGGFAEGGFTGVGGRYEPAGIVHRGEYVFSAPAVARLGAGNLDAMHGAALNAAPVNVNPSTNISLGFFTNQHEIPQWARSQAGETHIVDIVRRNIHMIQKG